MTINLKGGKELSAFLQAFPKKLANGAVRAGLVAAAAPIRDQARALAPRQTGQLAASIKTGSSRVNPDGTISITVRTDPKNNPHAFLGLFFEYGTAPHFITAGDSGKSVRLLNRAALRDGAVSDVDSRKLRIGNSVVTGGVMHPGMAARPFMRPALDMKANEAINAFGERVVSYLQSKSGFTAPTLEVDE